MQSPRNRKLTVPPSAVMSVAPSAANGAMGSAAENRTRLQAFSRSSLIFCVLGLMSAVLCFAMVARVYRARANRAPVEWGGALSRKEMAKIAAAVLAVIAAVIVSGVTKP